MKPKITAVAALVVFLVSCTPKPEKIAYGTNACHYCKMNIVDDRHASEIVTKKGKVYKYDAIECMLGDINANASRKVALYLVMDYSKPDNFTDATQAVYLISEEVPSPMGAFLSAFGDEQDAVKIRDEKSGELFSWEAIQKRFAAEY